ncbi:MAG: squalene/phytoene synthase family protein [Deltaproteobacteria bacterium]|nr:squalene/phytoene synthase family protein [Deltaproteobacteria bacterium]
MKPSQYCRNLCRQSKSNFVYAFRFLPNERRRALEAFYAFCTTVDAAVDCHDDKNEARELLLYWHREVANMYAGRPEHPVAAALAPSLTTFHVPRHYLDDIISGCEMDLDQTSYHAFPELEDYCYRVASCVGLVCLYIFGLTPNEQNLKTAIALGKALQLTNILRDIVHDHQLGRVYLPQEDFTRTGVTMADLVNGTNRYGTKELLTLEIRRARNFFAESFAGFPEDRKERRRWMAPLLIGKVYEQLLDRIEADPLAVMRERVTVSRWEKLKIIGRTVGGLYGFSPPL